jgi:MFS family permease
MRSFFGKYLEFLRRPGVATLMVVALLSRMPIGMVGFAMLMFLRERFGSFALAGSAVGVFFVAMAAAAPVQGRLIDRFGPRIPLLVTGIVQPFALVAVIAFAQLGLSYAYVAAAAAATGAFAPPITVLTRTIWRHRFERDDDRRTAFSLDAVLIEVNFTLGPAIIALMLAWFGTLAAFTLAIVVCVISYLIYILSPALTYFRREPPAERHMLGPLTEPRLLLLFTSTFGLTVCFGLMEVGYPGYGTALAMPALGGILLAVNAIGSGIGGAIYGGLHLRMPVERQYAAALGLIGIPLLLHAFVVDYPVLFGCVAFVAGLLIAPSIAAQSVLVSRIAPAKYATEAFTWSSTFIVSGLGAGMAVGGTLIETAGIRTAFVAAGAIACAMALLALLLPVSRVPDASAHPAQ